MVPPSEHGRDTPDGDRTPPSDDRRGFWGFWKTLPGVLTASASFIAAIATLVALFLPSDKHNDGPSTPAAAPVVIPQNSTATTSAGPTREEWVRAANKACQTMFRDLGDLGEPDPNDAVATAQAGQAYADVLNTAGQSLDAAPRPSADEDRVSRIVTNFTLAAGAYQQMSSDVQNGDRAQFAVDLAAAERRIQAARSQLHALGACST